ncbi:hypothetical protein SAY86_030588 [Trapa natans]|uniref:riboflavin kinase n=1 Tax=Trapa natans TaxID=22666 RepID=A0AAN7MG90_TRANT|nr:hypothetical protein SAY86_030588 [Trapa natans]
MSVTPFCSYISRVKGLTYSFRMETLKKRGHSLHRKITSMSVHLPIEKPMLGVIFDLDGTLINTYDVVRDVLKTCLFKFGKQWDGREADKVLGKAPFEAAEAVVEDYELPCTTEEFISRITPMFSDQWSNIKPLPGANRLIKHLKIHGIPMALASNSPRMSIESKISYQQGQFFRKLKIFHYRIIDRNFLMKCAYAGWKDSFSSIIGGNEVSAAKPSPDIFLEAANRLKLEPSNCLVIEDSLPGVAAGKAAGMKVIAVPYLPKQCHLYTSADEVINSLLDLRPEKWGLSPFQDWIEGTLPLEPWHIRGSVVKGFGRGSKMLGIPTANLSTEGHTTLLSEHPSGVYFGWAGLPARGVYKMVMSIGWNPYFNNKEKTIEPWLLHEFDEDFYGKELHLVIVGYIRPEMNFPSLEKLIEKIHGDRRIAEKALELPLYLKCKDDPYLKGQLLGDPGRVVKEDPRADPYDTLKTCTGPHGRSWILCHSRGRARLSLPAQPRPTVISGSTLHQ